MHQLSKLDAVNIILRAANELPVSSLDTAGQTAVSSAVAVLDEVTAEVQGMGCVESTEYRTLSPDANKHILSGTDWLSVYADPFEEDYNARFVLRDGRVWDSDNNTDEFTTEIRVKIFRNLSFDRLTHATQNYIANRAAVRYQQDTQGDAQVDQRLFNRELVAKIEWVSSQERSRNAQATPRTNGWLRRGDGRRRFLRGV